MIYVFGLLWTIFYLGLGLMVIAAIVEGSSQGVDDAGDGGKDDVPAEYLREAEGKEMDPGQ